MKKINFQYSSDGEEFWKSFLAVQPTAGQLNAHFTQLAPIMRCKNACVKEPSRASRDDVEQLASAKIMLTIFSAPIDFRLCCFLKAFSVLFS